MLRAINATERTSRVTQVTDLPVYTGAMPRAIPQLYFVPKMYARRLKVEIIVAGERRLCPLDWLDSFACAISRAQPSLMTLFRLEKVS